MIILYLAIDSELDTTREQTRKLRDYEAAPRYAQPKNDTSKT